MKYVFTAMIAAVALMFAAAPATADWDPIRNPATGEIINHKMHWPQMPDLEFGMNVLASSTHLNDVPVQKVLADDFLCTQTGPITDVHIWGSWWEDQFPWDPENPTIGPNAGNTAFRLSIHSDVPKSAVEPYSRPGELLWEKRFAPGEFAWRPWATANELFYDPNIGGTAGIIGTDTQIFQYNFLIPEAEAWRQEQGKIYWLDVTAFPGPIDAGITQLALFGWKTSADHWNDDAVYWDEIPGADPTFPQELIDPRTGVSLDMAFVITPEPGTVVMLIGAGLLGLLACARRRKRS